MPNVMETQRDNWRRQLSWDSASIAICATVRSPSILGPMAVNVVHGSEVFFFNLNAGSLPYRAAEIEVSRLSSTPMLSDGKYMALRLL